MTDHFDKWINGMTEEQYDDWLEDDATPAQEEKALNIRTPLSEEEEEDIERQQEMIAEPSRVREEIVYDNRNLPPKIIPANIIIPPTGKAPIIIPEREIVRTPTVIPMRIEQPPRTRISRQTLIQQISSFLSRLLGRKR